jgi:hypothetical protein
VAEVVEEVGDLGGGDSAHGELGKIVFGKKLSAGGFVAVGGGASDEVSEEEEFVGVESVGGMVVQIAIENRGEFCDANFVAGFFAKFADGGERGRFADIGPAAGKCPAAIVEFTNQQDAAVFECGDAHIDFGSGVTGLLGEDFLKRFRVGKSGTGGHHFRSDAANFVVALDIEFVFAIGEAGLRNGLQAARPCEPWRNRHGAILAARQAADKSGG